MSRRGAFEKKFEGLDLLDELLQLCNAVVDAAGAVEALRQAQAAGESAPEAIPTLFDGEPRFPDPEYARRTYQNLLGLWDELAAGRAPRARAEEDGKPRDKPAPAEPPGAFPSGGPDRAWVDAARAYLASLGKREWGRLEDAFENRQDALLQLLDEAGLPDDGWAACRGALLRAFCLLELGWPPGTRSVGTAEWKAAAGGMGQGVPGVLREAVMEGLQQVPAAEAAEVRALVEQGLGALWSARKG
ncbi:MAG: hypothetical protein RL653_1843 [Pseudomonadota bacterium]|jgi:hypothetical protein